MLGSWKYLRSKLGGGVVVSMIWYTLTHIGVIRTGGSVLRKMGQEVAQVWGKKFIYVC